MEKIEYSVVIPVFNSESALVELTNQLIEVFDKINRSWELILVDDHSTDASWKTIISLKKRFPKIIKGIHLARNYGQHNATLCGLSKAKGSFIITMDDDLQHSPDDIPLFIAKYKKDNDEIIYGVRPAPKDGLIKRFFRAWLKSTGKKQNNGVGDGSSFRMIKSRVAKQVAGFNMSFVYLDDMLYWHTDKIGLINVSHNPPKYRKSGYNSFKLFGILYNLFLFNTTMPLRIMTAGGGIASVVSLIAGIWLIIRKLVYEVPMGYTSTIVTILFSASIIIFGLGVIGEYLRRMYLGQTGQPAYSVDKDTEEKPQDEDK